MESCGWCSWQRGYGFAAGTRSARVKPLRVQNAALIAGLMITTEAIVAEMPKKDEPMGGGDMGGMGGMM